MSFTVLVYNCLCFLTFLLHKVPTAPQEQFWGSVSFSRILAGGSRGFKPATFRLLDDPEELSKVVQCDS